MPDSQRQMAAVKDNKMPYGKHSKQTLFNPLCQLPEQYSCLQTHGTEARTAKLCSIGETCPCEITVTSNSECFSSSASAFGALSPRERTVGHLTNSSTGLECDLEEDDAIPVVLDINNLKGVYQKKTRKTAAGFEHRLVNSRVNMTVTAQAQIRCLKCHVRRCR